MKSGEIACIILLLITGCATKPITVEFEDAGTSGSLCGLTATRTRTIHQNPFIWWSASFCSESLAINDDQVVLQDISDKDSFNFAKEGFRSVNVKFDSRFAYVAQQQEIDDIVALFNNHESRKLAQPRVEKLSLGEDRLIRVRMIPKAAELAGE